MSEPRRCQLTAVTAKDKSKISHKTVRICLKLDEPTDIANPEFSYLDLTEPKDVEKVDENDPFAAADKKEMEEMQKMADKLEAKYGNGKKKSFKRKRNIKDLIDIGEGYCEDSFVDNSEAYDEVVPWCLDTEHGGFYINEGFLDFVKNDDSHEQEEEDDDFQPKKKKSKLFEMGEKHKKKSKMFNSVDGKRPRLKKKLDKQKINTNSPQLTNGLEPKRLSTVTCSTSDTTANPNVSQQQHEKTGSITTTATVASKETVNNSTPTNDCQPFVEADQGMNELDESFSKCDEANKDDPTIGVMIEDLTSEIVGIVNRTKLPVQTGSSEEVQPPQIFTAHLLELLTRLHSLCQTRSSVDKHSVFEKLALVCGIQRELLYKKIKKFRMNLISEQINKCKLELKEAVSMEMPSMIEKYKHDLEESNKLKSEQKESMMTTSTVKESGESEAEDEGKGATEAEKLEKVKRIMAPRRKFLWTLEIRKLLCGVVDLKMRYFEMAKIKSQTAEEHLKNFLDSDIKPIWPTGWMQARALFKESRPAHQNWTGELVKQKKISGINNAVGPQKPSNPQLLQQPAQPQHHQQQQLQTSSVSNKTQTTTPSVSKAVEEPIVINLDESDNESSKVPAPNTPVKQNQQQQNISQKNVFTILKEKPVADSGIAPELTGAELHSTNFLDDAAVNMTSQRNQKTKELRVDEHVIHGSSNNTSTVPTSQQQLLQTSREYSGSVQKISSTVVQEPAVLAATPAKSCNASAVQLHEQPKHEEVFYGRIVHSSLSSVPMPTNSGKAKGHQPNPNPIGDNFGSAVSGFQAGTSNSETSPKQQQQRKRTNSYSPTFGTPILSKPYLLEIDTPVPSSAAGTTNILSGVKTSQFVETSPVTPKQKNTTADVQKNLNVVWDTSNSLRVQQQPSSVAQQQLYQQQLIQQKYQQYQQQQQRQQQQMIRKSPKQDKQISTSQVNAKTIINASQANIPSFQQQTPASGSGTGNHIMAPMTAKQQGQKDTTLVSGMSKLPATAGKDQPFSLSQRSFQSSATSSSYSLTQTDHKLIRDVIVSSQKSPVRKETVVTQQKQPSFGIPQQQQQALRCHQQLQIIAAAAAQQKLQQNVQPPQQIPQQLQFNQHFFQNPHFSQDNNSTTQHKK